MSEPDANAQLWEAHADWWQREFTDGADPEYTEQIIPLILEWTEGFERVLEVGTGEGQVARAIAATHGAAVIGIDPTVNQIDEAIRRGGGPEYQLRSTTHRSTPLCAAWCLNTSMPSMMHWPRLVACCARAEGSSSA